MKAFTFIEVLVLIAVTTVVGLTINSLIQSFYRDNAYLIQQSSAIDSARRGLRTSFESLRQASYGDDGSYPIQNAGTSSVTFFSDVDGDGIVDKVRLYLSNKTLYKGITESTASQPPTYSGQPETTYTIAQYVSNPTSTPIFRYYNSSTTELTGTIDISKIRSVSTMLEIDLNPQRAPDIFTLQETATLRNLRAN